MEGFSISIGESIPIYRISAVRDTSVWPQELIRTIQQKISSSEDAAKTMTGLFVSRVFRDLILNQGHNDRENMMIAAIDANHNLNGVMLAATGSEEEVTAGVKTVIRSALQMGATFLVIGHNHPTGSIRKRGKGLQYMGMEPSESDLRFTTQLYAACAVVGIQLVDHLILGGVDPQKWRSAHEQPYLSLWGRGYFKRDIFPALADATISTICPEVKLAARLAKKKQPRP